MTYLYGRQPPSQDDFIKSVFDDMVKTMLDQARLSREVDEYIFNKLMTEGFNLVLDFLDYEFSNRRWDNVEAQNIIGSVVQYIIVVEADYYRIQINEFTDGYTWVANTLPAVQRFVDQQEYEAQQAARGRDDRRYTGHYVDHRSPPVSARHGNHGYIHRSMADEPQRSTTLAQLAQNRMNKDHHIPNPKPNASSFRTQDTARAEPEPPVTRVEPPPRTARIKVSVADRRLEDYEMKTPGQEQQHQSVRIAVEANESSNPFVISIKTEKVIPLPTNTTSALTDRLASLAKSQDIGSAIDLINEIKDHHPDAGKLLSWISLSITKTALTALRHRYGLELGGFPIITQPDACLKYLDDHECRTDIEAILLHRLEEMFDHLEIGDGGVESGDDKSSKITLLVTVTKRSVLVLPWICGFQFADQQLLISGIDDPTFTDDVFKQAFVIVGDDVVELDIIDAALNRFRVYRSGKSVYAPMSYTVDYRE